MLAYTFANEKPMSKIANALRKTRFNIKKNLLNLVNNKIINEDDFNALERMLIQADCGTNTSNKLIEKLKKNCYKYSLMEYHKVISELEKIAIEWLTPFECDWQANTMNKHETVLFFGVNGAGKTTTIAKIAEMLKMQHKSIAIAAGDTFRAAAIEQLQAWGKQLDIPVIATSHNSDAASLVFDAITNTKTHDILLVDTSGRLQNNTNLMQELSKIVRVCKKADINAPHHRWLILDATLGINSIEQARVFHEHLNITGIIITKLDSSANAGAIFSIVETIKAPIIFATTGEDIKSLEKFSAHEFVSSLFASKHDEL